MKICFIGNSHLGPIAAASHVVSSGIPGLEMVHYISRTYGALPLKMFSPTDVESFPYVKIENRQDVDSLINVDDWDAFVIVGFGFSLIRLVEKWVEFQPDSLGVDLGGHLLVPGFVDAYENECMDSTQAVRLMRRVRDMTGKPIYLVPAPFPAEWAGNREGEKFRPFRAIKASGEEPAAISAFERQLRRLPGRRIKPIKQPQSTVTDLMWTDEAFALGQPSERSETSFYARGDFYHMNKTFGEIYLREIVSVVVADLGMSESTEKTGS